MTETLTSPAALVAQIPADVRAVARKLHERGFAAHLVGGGVRDMLLGRPPADFDLATDAVPEKVLEIFGGAFAIPTGLKHGTVTVLTGGDPATRRSVEVTTFRGEGAYLDGRRPSSVTYVSTLDEDLSRRDFTMNAIALDPLAAALTDPFGGQADLARKLIRAVGDPVARFREDGLRPMRAVRQAAQLGFDIEAATLAAIEPTLDVFRMVSAERVRDEMLKMLCRRAAAVRVPRSSCGARGCSPWCFRSFWRALAARRTGSTNTTLPTGHTLTSMRRAATPS